MRLDKWLKLSRIIKRRTIAQMACEQGRVFINEKTAKAASEVHLSDTIHLELGGRALTIKVLKTPEKNIPAQEATNLYEIIEELRRPPEVLEWLGDKE